MLTVPHVYKLFLCIEHKALWVPSVFLLLFFLTKVKYRVGSQGVELQVYLSRLVRGFGAGQAADSFYFII